MKGSRLTTDLARSGGYPKVSFVMPTLNAADIVENCLQSIARQTYPRDRYEILLADAGSTDGTRDIAKRYGAIVLNDQGRNMEEGKRLALLHATGEYIVFVDADNEFTHPDYVELAVNALATNPQALGVESYYLPSPKMSSFCAYLTHLLQISDPVCWLMSVEPKLISAESEDSQTPTKGNEEANPPLAPPKRGTTDPTSLPSSGGEGGGLKALMGEPKIGEASHESVLGRPTPDPSQEGNEATGAAPLPGGVGGGFGDTTRGQGLETSHPIPLSRRRVQGGQAEHWTLPPGTMAYPLGANGFVFRKDDLDAVRAQQHFQDTHVALHLMEAGKREWLRIRGRGVHHYYVQTLWGFVQKRRRAMVHFLNVRKESQLTWIEQKPPVPGWLACLYCVTIVGPLYHTVVGLIKDRDVRWLWHLPASVASIVGMVWGYQTHLTRSKEKNLIAKLKPPQSLR